MKLDLFQVDAFAERPFEGNPAAVVPLDTWLSDEQMLAIAAENNLAETAFFVAEGDGYRLRWFTPALEVELCGHATLATAHVILTRLKTELDQVVFETRSGTLTVRRGDNGKDNGKLVMDFPARASKPMPIPGDLGPMLGVTPRIVLSGANLIAVFDSAADVARLRPAFEPLGKYLGPRNQGLIATAPGDADSGFDFVSRFFAPSHGVEEDHVTGSAHCDTTPFWAKKLKKNEMVARQISSRGGTVGCRLDGDRVYLEGACADYLEGTISIGNHFQRQRLMNWELLGFAALFGLVLMATPGPANLSLMAVSASVGFQRARLYLFGIWVGGFLVTALVGLGVGALLQAQPLLYGALQVVGLGYIAWLAWRLAHLDGSHGTAHAEPSFWAGAALHPLNPKAYVMNVTAFASFIAPGMAYDAQAVFLGITLGLIMIVCTTSWALGGEMLRHWLTQARYARVVRQVLAVAMVASVAIPMVIV